MGLWGQIVTDLSRVLCAHENNPRKVMHGVSRSQIPYISLSTGEQVGKVQENHNK